MPDGEWYQLERLKESAVPSVERFNDADFRKLVRWRGTEAAECAICLSSLSSDEARLLSWFVVLKLKSYRLVLLCAHTHTHTRPSACRMVCNSLVLHATLSTKIVFDRGCHGT